MRINLAVPEPYVSKPVLDAALEGVTRLNEQLIKAGASPTSDQLIRQGARWKPEPPGQEHFDHGAIIAKRGHGDCDDWAPLAAATRRVTGEDPGARAVVRKSGLKKWHAVVRRSDGSIEDPSKEAGMPGRGHATPGVHGAWLPVMRHEASNVSGEVGTFVASPHLALRPVRSRGGQVEAWQARADLPWHYKIGRSPSDIAMASLHQSPVTDQAVVGAVRGALRLGMANGAHPEQLRRLAAIADACEGCPWEDLAHRYGPAHATAAGAVVGGFFGKLWKKAKKIAKVVVKNPITSAALSFVPGGGLAKSALSMASPLFRKSVKRGRHKPPSKRRGRSAFSAMAKARARARARAAARKRRTRKRPTRRRVVRRAAPRRRVVRRTAPRATRPATPQFLPYPYPLPYPIPGGSNWGASVPGQAWPARR